MSDWIDISVFGVALLIMLVGWFGLLVPFFPGVELIWITALAYGLLNKFGTLGGWMFALITLIGLFAMVIDNILMAKLARRQGAAWKSLLLGLLGGIIGIALWPPWGGLVGAPLVVFLFEYLRVKDWKQAWLALRGLAFGWLASLVVRFLLAGAMVGLWLIWAFNH